MPKNKPGLVRTPLDELTYKVNGLAMQAQRELKSGHKEVFYQRRLAELCLESGIQAEMEKRVEVWIGDSMVGYLYLDLWVEQNLVVECKALNHDLTNEELSQVLVYLAATGAPVGMLYNFGRSNLEYRRILRPRHVQEWQKYLYRCVWTPPGKSLPPENSPESGGPIRFSILSPLANQPVVLESGNSPAQDPVDVRESVKSSAYESSGVSIQAGNRAVELMKTAVRQTYSPAVLAGIGSFGGLFDVSMLKEMKNPVLVASIDGVGTKVKLAAQAGRYRPIGHDIVNHCINDILVQGAHPLFFLDYFATSNLQPERAAEVVTGIAEACKLAGMALLGGETAEMPGVYQPDEFDLAGTIVGVVERERILPRPDLRAGDVLLGLASSGPHTNGFSLLREILASVPLETIFPELGIPLAEALLAPHRSYLSLLEAALPHVKALAHITGGGFIENIPRVLPDNLDAIIRRGAWPVPPLWKIVQERGGIAVEEMFHVFNMGIGMVVIADGKDETKIRKMIPEEIWEIGKLVDGSGKVILQ